MVRGLSPVSSHDYPEYKTPSKQYENGSITCFEVITCLPRPYHNSSQCERVEKRAVKEKNIESFITRESSVISWDTLLDWEPKCIILSDVRISSDNLRSHIVDSQPGHSSLSLVRHTRPRESSPLMIRPLWNMEIT